MKTIQLAVAAVLSVAGSAQAQRAEAPPPSTLEPVFPAAMRGLPSYPGFFAGNEGLPPADPKAPDYWRPDPKLYAGYAFSPYVGIDLQFTNHDYREGMRFRGFGPRLAEGVALGAHGFNLDLTARAAVPVDDWTTAFATAGVSARGRKYAQGNINSVSPVGSVGVSTRINSRQTATVEIPLGVGINRIGGASRGYGATVKMGF